MPPGTGPWASVVVTGVLTLIPAIVAFVYVARIATDVPFYDEWRFVPLIRKWQAGTLAWADLVEQHDGHRIVATRLSILASAWLTHWNILYEVWGGFAFLLATGLLLFWLHWRTSPPNRRAAWTVLGALPLMAIVFSLRQWENLTAPWALCMFSLNFFVLLTFVLVQHKPRPLWLPAAIAATLASCTFTNGLLVWPIVVVQVVLDRWRPGVGGRAACRQAARSLVPWLSWAAVFSAVYFRGYSSRLAQSTAGLRIVVLRFLAALGTSVSPDRGIVAGGSASIPSMGAPLSITLGLFLLVVLFIALGPLRGDRRPSDHPIHVAVALFGLGSVALLALGRSYLGVAQACSSRYTTSASMLLVALVLALAHAGHSTRRALAIRRGLIAVVLCANVAAMRGELAIAGRRAAGLRAWARRVKDYRTTTDEQFANPHFPAQYIREWSEVLERAHLSVFRRSR